MSQNGRSICVVAGLLALVISGCANKDSKETATPVADIAVAPPAAPVAEFCENRLS